MEILVGESPEPGSSKAIVFAETGQCFLRNWGKAAKLEELFNPDTFLCNVALLIDHENMHQLLYDIGETEAYHRLNKIDGFSGHLVQRRIRCFVCRKIIYRPPYILHLLSCWHKSCFEKFRKTQDYQIMASIINRELYGKCISV